MPPAVFLIYKQVLPLPYLINQALSLPLSLPRPHLLPIHLSLCLLLFLYWLTFKAQNFNNPLILDSLVLNLVRKAPPPPYYTILELPPLYLFNDI
jgi:hypothetical protein